MPKYPEYDQSTYPQYRFVECDNYFTSRGFVKFNLECVIKIARNFRRPKFEDDPYLNEPLIGKENYV
jgi:hypothetical protein